MRYLIFSITWFVLFSCHICIISIYLKTKLNLLFNLLEYTKILLGAVVEVEDDICVDAVEGTKYIRNFIFIKLIQLKIKMQTPNW